MTAQDTGHTGKPLDFRVSQSNKNWPGHFKVVDKSVPFRILAAFFCAFQLLPNRIKLNEILKFINDT